MEIEDAGQYFDLENVRSSSFENEDRNHLLFPKNYKTGSSFSEENKTASNLRHSADVDQLPQFSIPGTQKVWLKTYGCSHNISDSEYMEGILTNYGYRMTENSDEADIWLLNSCTVKDPSQAAFMHLVKKAKGINKPVVVAGCVPQADRNLDGLEDVSVVGITQIDRVVEVVDQTLNGNFVKLLSKKKLPSLDLPKVRKNPQVEIIPLSTGCLGSCTYCKTRQARGKLGSYSPEAIIERTKSAIREGVSEIWLSSEDTGAYGIDIGTDIGKLLKAIIQELPNHGVMLRVGMTNPPYILQHLKVIAEVLQHPNVYSFLHVPVQAGSNKVLTAMNREYTVEDFKTVVDYLQVHVPNMTIATDIICGFPNESESDFDETIKLIENYRFGIVNISQFYPRPGTPAAKMKRIQTQIVKDRSRRLTKLFESFTPHEQLVGTVQQVWFDIEISDDGNHNVGHNKSYVKVLVPKQEGLPGTSYWVKIVSSFRFHVVGELLTCVHESNRSVQDRVTKKSEVAAIHECPGVVSDKAGVTSKGTGNQDLCGTNSCECTNNHHADHNESSVLCPQAKIELKGEQAVNNLENANKLSNMSKTLIISGIVCVGISIFIVIVRKR